MVKMEEHGSFEFSRRRNRWIVKFTLVLNVSV